MPQYHAPLSGETVEQIVRTMIEIHGNPQMLAEIEQTATSCGTWARTLQQLFVDSSIEYHYFRRPGYELTKDLWENIQYESLYREKPVFAEVNLPVYTSGERVGEHVFTIVPDGNGNAYILHAWQDMHGLRAEPPMPIEEMIKLLRKLTKYDYTKPGDISKIRKVRRRLWGEDHMGPSEPLRRDFSGRKRVTFASIASGEPKRPLLENKEALERLANVRARSMSSQLASASEELSEEEPLLSPQERVVEGGGGGSTLYAMGVAAGLGFVLGAGGALLSGEDWDDILEEGVKTAVAFGVGEGVGQAIGGSVVRSTAAAGAATFAVFALWDVAHWAKHDITGVQLRKKLAQGAGSALGGVAGGAAVGAASGALLGPVGAFFGGLIGGVAGGIGGAKAAEAVDEALWDEGEDCVMNAYEFFKWHNVSRGTRPIRSAREISRAYTEKLGEKPSQKLSNREWDTVCTAQLMILLRAMFPEFKRMLELAKQIHDNKSKSMTFVAMTVHSNLSVPPRTEERLRPRTSRLSSFLRGCGRVCKCCGLCVLGCMYFSCCCCCCC